MCAEYLDPVRDLGTDCDTRDSKKASEMVKSGGSSELRLRPNRSGAEDIRVQDTSCELTYKQYVCINDCILASSVALPDGTPEGIKSRLT